MQEALDKIQAVLKENQVPYQFCTGQIENFNVFMTLSGTHDPAKTRKSCHSDDCRFLRNGKIYKCPLDALSFKFAERFGVKNFPASMGVDIFAKNFTALIQELDGNIELCYWCNETARLINWTPENNPKITDWIVNPEEIKLLE